MYNLHSTPLLTKVSLLVEVKEGEIRAQCLATRYAVVNTSSELCIRPMHLHPCLRCRCGFMKVRPAKMTALPAIRPNVTQYTIHPALLVPTNPVPGCCTMSAACCSDLCKYPLQLTGAPRHSGLFTPDPEPAITIPGRTAQLSARMHYNYAIIA